MGIDRKTVMSKQEEQGNRGGGGKGVSPFPGLDSIPLPFLFLKGF